MDIAVAKANKVGVAWVNCVGEFPPLLQKLNIYNKLLIIGSNHYGMASYYAQKAADQGMIVSNMHGADNQFCKKFC